MIAKEKVGFAVVGLGAIAQSSILPAFAHCKRAKLVALVGSDEKKTAQLATKFRAKYRYRSDQYAACLANSEISAVYIATPPGAHAGLTIQACQAHRHVLCEKPLAAKLADSAAMVEACRKNGVLLMTAYRKFFEPSALYLKQMIQSGDLGRIDVIHTAFSELHLPNVSLPWMLDSKMAGGGPLMDLGVYCVNTTRWLVEEDPVEATARSWVHDTVRFQDVEQGISFRLQFPSGLVVQGSSSYDAVLSSFIFIQGAKGWLSLSPAFPFDEDRILTGKIGKRRIHKKFEVTDEFAPEVDTFARAIQNNQSVEADGIQGHRDMIILDAIYQAARTQQSVTIRY